MRISDWSSDVCSSDLGEARGATEEVETDDDPSVREVGKRIVDQPAGHRDQSEYHHGLRQDMARTRPGFGSRTGFCHRRRVSKNRWAARSEEHTSEIKTLMRISYAVLCSKKKHEEQ